MFNKFFGSVLIVMLLAAFSACTRNSEVPNDPKKILSSYISRSFSIKSPSDREELVSYLARDAKARLLSWSDDQFRQAFVESRREFIKLTFTESKSVSAAEMNITYELTYMDLGGGKDAKVTQKKMAQLVLDQGKWQIADVQNIKELVEYRHEMSLP